MTPSLPAQRHVPTTSRRAQRRAIWALTYVVVLLVVLAVVPMIIASSAQVHRRLIADTIEPARIAAGELEAYFLEQMLADPSRASRTSLPVRASRGAHDPAGISRQWATLDSAAAMLGGEVAAHVTDLARATTRGAGGAGDASRSAAAALRTVAASQRLQEWLDMRSAQERAAAIEVERWNVWVPLVLLPLALLGVVALLIAGREISRLGRVAQRSAAALAEATKAKAALLRGVTHDLKNPLGAARGFTELLSAGLAGALPERSHEAVGRVHRLLGDAIDILKDLTELARAESGELAVVFVPTRLDRAVEECVGDHQATAQRRGVTLTADPDDLSSQPSSQVLTDPRRLRQILDNLLTNALKYTPEHGTVRVATRMMPDAGEARITVSDTGPGVPADMRTKIFDEFFRLPRHELDLRPGAAPGTGVGLTISRRLARLLGGDLTVDAAPEGGAAFTLALPALAPRGARTS